ncbi:MAG: glycerol-3-phosphate 1-O-acyltransferase PlsY [Candidatus Pacebacteria bacterium]|nr:glycerol-3-phosphate 1-O-acyltransferase PlsY [Candidatus Paceibacterota bacterium]
MNQDLIFILLILFAYFSASTPVGYLIAKSKKIDIRKQGSGNVGGTNILRSLGFSYFLVVVILDILKVAVPVLLAFYFSLSEWQIAIISLFAIIGNMYSFWLNFKGGKAVSAVFAVLICFIGIKNALQFLFIWALLLYALKIMSLTNLIIIFIVPVAIWYSTQSIPFTILGILFIPIIWWAHRENIKRLAKKTESKIIKF